MIHPYSTVTLNQWNRGELRVQIDTQRQPRPMGYCDGTPEDEASLRAMAEGEDAGELQIHKKLLKTGREIWTVTTVWDAEEE